MDKKRITITFLIVLTNAVGATAILPMLPIYAEEQFRATPVQAMFVIAAYYAAQFVAAPWLGKLSDRFGRRSILIISQIGTVLSYLLFIFALPLGDHVGIALGLSGGLIVIYVARLLDGLTGGNVSVAEAYASDISDEKSRAHALGLIGGASGLGHILGPALAVALSGISLIAPMVGALVASGATLNWRGPKLLLGIDRQHRQDGSCSNRIRQDNEKGDCDAFLIHRILSFVALKTRRCLKVVCKDGCVHFDIRPWLRPL